MRPDRAKEGNAPDLPPLHSLVFDHGVGLIAKRIHVARRGGLLVLGVLLPSRLRVCRSREWVHAVDAHISRYNGGVGWESGQEMQAVEIHVPGACGRKILSRGQCPRWDSGQQTPRVKHCRPMDTMDTDGHTE